MPARKTQFLTTLAILLIGAATLFAQPAQKADHPKWSVPVNGLQARLELRPSQVVNGTPIIATYLILRNASDAMNPLTVPLSEKLLSFRVVDARGKEIPKFNGPFDGHMLAGDINLVLPVRSELSFDYSSHGAGVPGDKAALIDLGPDSNWALEPNQGDCFLHAILEVPKPAALNNGPTRPWHGKIELPPVKIPVGREPIDPETIEVRINELGAKMLGEGNENHDVAMQELSRIEDPRVVPWYLKALDTNNYELKFNALDRLARFNTDEALAGLKKGTTTQGADIGNCSTPQVAADMANNIRHAAAGGLARSQHPDAPAILLTLADDPYDGVRIDVIHALEKMKSPESLALLKKMTADPTDSVRNEARRCLELREAKAKQ